MFELGKTYKTRCGKNARVVCIDRKSPDGFALLALVLQGTSEFSVAYKVDGTCTPEENKWDLMPPKEEIWINKNQNGVYAYQSKEQAERQHKSIYATDANYEYVAKRFVEA